MTDYAIHRPKFTGTTTNHWEFPTEQDFDTDDLSAIADHHLLSSSGFEDPDDFDDLELPVVNTQGYLSLNGLWAAREGPYSIERIADIDDGTREEVRALINDIGTENFAEFKDVTVTTTEWTKTGEGGLPNPLGGVVDSVISPARPSYSPWSAVVGLVFLAGSALALSWYNDQR